MKFFDWNEEKNEELKRTRNISFEIVVSQIEMGNVLDLLEHPNKDKYQHQRIIVIEYNEYAYLVPYVEDEEKIFLKTIIPSRKATKQYLKN
ncbi:MAG: BrnT family toxin [Ignavibacteriae bacterium]|nr:BrnT family toxin [Ignavibacteriota bacterium]